MGTPAEISLSLFPKDASPLDKKLGRDFFKSIPTGPGVYYFRSESAALLYVGKAKNLRNRLNSYRRVRGEESSRKVRRMVMMVHKIEWSCTATELDALLLENKLLREEKPVFNVINTRPETYFFLAWDLRGEELELLISTQPTKIPPSFRLFGAFRSKYNVREAYAALARLLWCLSTPASNRWEIPSRLLRDRPHPRVCVPFKFPAKAKLLESFCAGRSSRFLFWLLERLLENTDIPPFTYQMVQRDLESLERLFKDLFRRQKRLIADAKLSSPVIPQFELDDWIIKQRLGGM